MTRKAALFQKMLKQEHTKEYKIHIMNEEEDLAEYNFHFTFGLEIRQLIKNVDLGRIGQKCCLWIMQCYTDKLEEEDKASFEAFPDPTSY